ncbi:MAG: hypothetical protein GEV09_04805 [Pseudonocardiaceae bacterium]|nr:hypothetical protein [Pseudonocardiaceae bacterium]
MAMWELQGGPTWLESWTARLPLVAALLHGLALAGALALVNQATGLSSTTALVVVVFYSAFVYIRGREQQAALRRYRASVDAATTAAGGRGMPVAQEPKHPTLRAVYWREEILGVVLWLRGEGLDESLEPDALRSFLGIDPEKAAAQLDRLAAQGYLQRRPDGRYVLSRYGEEEGQRLVEGDRAVPPPTSGACGPDCWCSSSPMEALRCDAG